MSLSHLLMRARPIVEQKLRNLSPPYTLFFSISDGKQRAKVLHVTADELSSVWQAAAIQARKMAKADKLNICWLRIDWVFSTEQVIWRELYRRFTNTKRGYFRYGLALDPQLKVAFLEQELNGNAMLYGGNQINHVVINHKNFKNYLARRYGKEIANQINTEFPAEQSVFILSTEGVFCEHSQTPVILYKPGRNAGRRVIDNLEEKATYQLIDSSSRYLSSQVLKNGRFNYGWHACFDRSIATYNTLRHASSTYAMLEAWEVTGNKQLILSIEKSLKHLTKTLIKQVSLNSGEKAAFLVESNGEIKLGGNAVCLLALVKYSELTESNRYDDLLEKLAVGIRYMQDQQTGKFVHVLQYPELTVKEEFRIIYYDGEAAFGLMRLYGLKRDSRWLALVEKAFEYFIAADHWQAHDHWLSYCVNELTLYRPEERYYQFGIQNVADHLDFVENRITTFPTLLELMMAAERMVTRLQQDDQHRHLLDGLDIPTFYRALHTRAHYLLNGYFWPEYAMYFQNPARIVGSFFIRHHAFRVRIDDVEHYLSGYVAYRKYLQIGEQTSFAHTQAAGELPLPAKSTTAPVVVWGGDVNLARRQHYRTAELGEQEPLGRIPALNSADLRIVNLECVVATSGTQGVKKGERAPYYYRARPEMLRILAAANIDIVTTANNHSGDYGPQALLEQQQWLDIIGIGHTGSGINLQDALKPAIRPAGNLNVAVFSLDATQKYFAASSSKPGSAYLPLSDPDAWFELLTSRIAKAREQAHVVMVAVHWGDNLEQEPGSEEIAVGRAIIDAGADAVLGTSAHLLQGIEIYNGRPILHDAGDLLFDSVRKNLAAGGVFQLQLNENGVNKITFVPIGIGFGYSKPIKTNSATSVSHRFAEKSAKLGTTLNIRQDGCAEIELRPPERTKLNCPTVQSTQYNLGLLAQLANRVNPEWYVETVPEDARISPLHFGPLTLLGVKVRPSKVDSRQLLWVESYWTTENPIADDYRIDIRAVPIRPTAMTYWGKSMDHDPCDWQMPTTRWQPGIIYRDCYGLRPPAASELENIDLQLEIGVLSPREVIAPIAIKNQIIALNLPETKRKSGAINKKLPVYRAEFPEIIHENSPGQTWNAEQLVAMTGGSWLTPPPKNWFVRSVVSGKGFIDQTLGPVLFVAHTSDDRAYHERSSSLPAKHWDLHHSIKTIAGKIAGVIVAKPVEGLPKELPVLLVKDPIHSIIELGLAARSRFNNTVVAITGTAGKSTTLKMLDCMLGDKQKVLCSLGNYNSRVGAPSMLASLNPEHEAAIIEVAQSGLWMKSGPITRRIRPTIALITEIGVSQTSSRVKTVKDTAVWKSRIFDGLTGEAVAIIGEHLQCFDYIESQARKYAKRVITFGTSPNAEVRIVNVQGDGSGSWVTLQTPNEALEIRVPAPSSGMVYNAVAAICVLHAMGRNLQASTAPLMALQLDEGHLNHTELNIDGRKINIIDDSWNATVSSMLNAFSVLAQAEAAVGGRKVAVLGRIVQLGEQAQILHESLAEPLLASGVDWIITHGQEMQYLRALLPQDLLGPHFSTAPELVKYLAETVQQSDLLLIKGSRRDSDFGSVPARLAEEASSKTVS